MILRGQLDNFNKNEGEKGEILMKLVNHTILIHIDSSFEQSFHLKGTLQDSPSHMVVKPFALG